jgi:hypothetical protein
MVSPESRGQAANDTVQAQQLHFALDGSPLRRYSSRQKIAVQISYRPSRKYLAAGEHPCMTLDPAA